jgi:hypothetical protein
MRARVEAIDHESVPTCEVASTDMPEKAPAPNSITCVALRPAHSNDMYGALAQREARRGAQQGACKDTNPYCTVIRAPNTNHTRAKTNNKKCINLTREACTTWLVSWPCNSDAYANLPTLVPQRLCVSTRPIMAQHTWPMCLSLHGNSKGCAQQRQNCKTASPCTTVFADGLAVPDSDTRHWHALH